MPELPEVEHVRQGIYSRLKDRRISKVETYVPRLREPLEQDQCNSWQKGSPIVDVRRRGKYLILVLDDDKAVLIHLGMSGQLIVINPDLPPKRHERVRWYLSGDLSCRFLDQRRFGLVQNCTVDRNTLLPPELDHLGPEPLSDNFNADYLGKICSRFRSSVKTVLLNQRVVAGLGNIYVNEALFRSGVRPDRSIRSLKPNEQSRLIREIRAVLREAIAHRGTTFRDYRDADGTPGGYAAQLKVYGKEHTACPRCTGDIRIRRFVQEGRSSYTCPACQR